MRTSLRAAGVLVAALLGGGAVESPPNAVAAGGPCGALPYPAGGPPAYEHVVVVMDENVSYDHLGQTGQAPHLHGLAAACGSETQMHTATHPSQPNYMAATSGWASGVGRRSDRDNVFHQVQAAGGTWASFQESMKSPCGAGAGPFQPGHDPARWYSDLRRPTDTCRVDDVPLTPALSQAIAGDALPTFSWITPDACHNMHWQRGCPMPRSQRVAAGDRWLADLVPRLVAMPSYRSGRTLVLITWDEGDGSATRGVDCTSSAVYTRQRSCRIPTIVISPYVAPGRRDGTAHDLYGLLGTVEDILGYPRLGSAVGRPSLRPGLGF